MYIKPTHPQVPDVDRGGYLAAEGREVEQNQYWLRRQIDGDVIETSPPPAGSFLPRPETKPTRKGS